MVGSWKTRWFIYIFPPKDKTTGYLVPGSVHCSIFRPGTAGSWIRLRHRCLFFFFNWQRSGGKVFWFPRYRTFGFNRGICLIFGFVCICFSLKSFFGVSFFLLKRGFETLRLSEIRKGEGRTELVFAVVVLLEWWDFMSVSGQKWSQKCDSHYFFVMFFLLQMNRIFHIFGWKMIKMWGMTEFSLIPKLHIGTYQSLLWLIPIPQKTRI